MTQTANRVYLCAMPKLNRNFLAVSQVADRLHVSERAVLNWISMDDLHAEPLDPGRQRTTWIVAITEVQLFEKERQRFSA